MSDKDAQWAVNAMHATLKEVLEELKRQSADLALQNHGLDPTPWPFKLSMEADTWADEDGNGMVFGRDFHLAENPVNVPPVLLPAYTAAAAKSKVTKGLTWEEYRDGLPPGRNRDAVSRFVGSLAYRAEKPAGEVADVDRGPA